MLAACSHCGSPGARSVLELGPLQAWVPRIRFCPREMQLICIRCTGAYNAARCRAAQQPQPSEVI
jgi:hypothetical protein